MRDASRGRLVSDAREFSGWVRHIDYMDRLAELERSHAELRAALILAGREIRRLNFGRTDSAVLKKLRAVLRDAWRVAKANSLTDQAYSGVPRCGP